MRFRDLITRMLLSASRRGDIAIAAIVLIAVIMMIIPLPTEVVDVLITANMAAAVLILLIAFYISEPLDLSSLPSLILIATLFRLAITISTARLILLQADAGEIINTFGNFVVGGNVAVGLVVFVIITVAQFVVITKGAERVAEVAARFTLDALPGKQMAIDSDLRGGDIDQSEARRQRRRLGHESHLYGAMDGAMKFVRGDAIASLIIIAVNLIGGLSIGTLQHGLPLSSAASTYSLLTVGDGLVAQIPALLVSVAAGTVVTRVGSAERLDLGSEIFRQLQHDPRALYLAAVILLVLALIPGFPWPAFVALATVFGLAGFWARARNTAAEEAGGSAAADGKAANGNDAAGLPQRAGQTAPAASPAGRFRIAVCLGAEVAERVPPQDFDDEVAVLRRNLTADLGFEPPAIGRLVDGSLAPQHVRIDVEGVPVFDSEIPADCLLVDSDPVDLQLLGIPWIESRITGELRPAMWVESTREAALAGAGIELFAPVAVVARWLRQTLRRYATQFVGIQETRDLLVRTDKEYPELMKEVQKIPTQKVAEILRRLLDEHVPIGNMRSILEALVEWGAREQDPVRLVEYVRIALRRQICFRCADRNRVIAAYMLERATEEGVRSSVVSTPAGSYLNISDAAARPIVQRVRDALAAAPGTPPVVLAAMDVRRHIRSLLIRYDMDIPVLSYQELAPEFSVQPLAERLEATQKATAQVAAAE